MAVSPDDSMSQPLQHPALPVSGGILPKACQVLAERPDMVQEELHEADLKP